MADMPDTGFRTINVTEGVHKKLVTKAQQEKKSIASVATSILASYMEADEKLSRYAPFIELFGFEGNAIILKDHKLDRFVDVYLHEKKLHCAHDDSKECNHIAFCLALSQVRKVVRG